MKTKFIKGKMKYDGRQLTPIWAYTKFGLSGDSIVSWIGPCDIKIENMVDAEDQIAGSEIRGDLMLHFIIEIFDRELFSAVSLQRLFASLAKDYLNASSKILKGNETERSGDDIYWKKSKLSISIASCSSVSSQIHFAMNIVNTGTPVKTCCLNDFKLKPESVAIDLMHLFEQEYESIRFATQKVHPL
ncbi:MAG: DUF366 family protein [Bdellovibrionota bacterium]